MPKPTKITTRQPARYIFKETAFSLIKKYTAEATITPKKMAKNKGEPRVLNNFCLKNSGNWGILEKTPKNESREMKAVVAAEVIRTKSRFFLFPSGN